MISQEAASLPGRVGQVRDTRNALVGGRTSRSGIRCRNNWRTRHNSRSNPAK